MGESWGSPELGYIPVNPTQDFLERFQALAAEKGLEVARLRHLLQLAHDKMDDKNAEFDGGRPFCVWCDESKAEQGVYDSQGLWHKPDCVLVLIRKELNGQ